MYTIDEMPYADRRPTTLQERQLDWLRSIKVQVSRDVMDNSTSIPMRAILDSLNRQGLRITTSIPVDAMNYRGFSIPAGTDGLTALEIITTQMGADYIIRDGGGQPFVSIIEMGSSQHRLNVSDVETGISILSSALNAAIGGTQGGGTQGGGAQGGMGGGAQGGMGGGAQGGMGGGAQGGQSGGQGQTTFAYYHSNFWDSLEKELEAQMTVPMPIEALMEPPRRTPIPPEAISRNTTVTTYTPERSGQVRELYRMTTVGQVTINRSTGNITITAPRHIRERIGAYLDTLNDLINTRLEIRAEVISVTTSKEESRGIDIAGFRQFYEGRYGVSLTNNTLGNVSVSSANVFSAAADGALTQTLIGVQSTGGMFSAFSSYLQTFGETNVVTEFTGATRSGRTYEHRRLSSIPRIETQTNDVIGAGATSSSSTTTTFYDSTGTLVTITPSFDPNTGMINSLVNLELRLNAGEVEEEVPITSDGNIAFRTTRRTAFDEVVITSETPSRAGELIVVGGYRTSSSDDTRSGVTGLVDSVVGGLFGRSRRAQQETRMFLLISIEPVYHDR